MDWLSLASGGLDLASMFSSFGGSDNASTAFHEAQAFSAKEAQKQRDFEQSFYNTRHQNEVADLRAAGLNPILSTFGQPPMAAGASAASVAPDYNQYERSTQRQTLRLASAKAAMDSFVSGSQVKLNNQLAAKASSEKTATDIENKFNTSPFGQFARYASMLTGPGIALGSLAGGAGGLIGNILKNIGGSSARVVSSFGRRG